MFQKYKKLIIAVIIILGFFLYSIMFGGDIESDSLLTSSAPASAQSSTDILGADIIRAINQISALDLDRSVFDHPVLQRLVDRGEPITPQSVGRDNPFAPLGVVSVQQDTVNQELDF